MMKMDIDQQIKKISKAQQDKKKKEEDQLMKKRQEILAKALGGNSTKTVNSKQVKNDVIGLSGPIREVSEHSESEG